MRLGSRLAANVHVKYEEIAMTWKGLLKPVVIGAIMILLGIGLLIVHETVSERSERRQEVYKDVARSTAAAQIVAGPFLVLPYEGSSAAPLLAESEPGTLSVRKQEVEVILPRELRVTGTLQAEPRARSLYQILLYRAQLQLAGSFSRAAIEERKARSPKRRWLTPYLLVLIQDSRGLKAVPVLTWNDKKLPLQPGHRGVSWGMASGVHADLSEGIPAEEDLSFSLDLSLSGMQSFGWVPVGETSVFQLASDWPHPSFQGQALPEEHAISAAGFTATWRSTLFSNNIAQLVSDPAGKSSLIGQELAVRLIDPVDIYQQSERSVKYGFLLIALSFAVFLLVEILQKLRIHPVQYTLVGLALLIFYVLLLALSEHIAFAKAYLAATSASVGLVGLYLRSVLHSWKSSAAFAGVLALLDAVIYGILQAEDYALLYGACLLFSLLAAAMLVTRRVRWEELGKEGSL